MPKKEIQYYQPERFLHKGSLCEIELEIFRQFGVPGVNFNGPTDSYGFARDLNFRILSKKINKTDLWIETVEYDGYLGKMTIEIKKVIESPGLGYEGELDQYGNAYELELTRISNISR